MPVGADSMAAAQYDPGMQPMGADEPAGQYDPAEQAAPVVLSEGWGRRALPLQYHPALQVPVMAESPAVWQYAPAGQAMHSVRAMLRLVGL